MKHEKFMQEARQNVHKILESKENAIMNIIQQAWFEGNRSVEVKTLWAALDKAIDKQESTIAMSFDVESYMEPVYPTWGEWLINQHVVGVQARQVPLPKVYYLIEDKMNTPIPAEMAQKLGIEPKED